MNISVKYGQTGAMAKGWANIGGVEYYFNKETGVRE